MRGFEPRACSLLNYRSTAELHRQIDCIGVKKVSGRRDSNSRGHSPVDFESTPLTALARPQILFAAKVSKNDK